MPNLTWNKQYWDGAYDWPESGEEWSEAWGGSEAQWFGSLYPRIHRFLPAEKILEIAPGYGRWTRYLLQYVSKGYAGIDLSAECIEHCKEIFSKAPNTAFYQNDGKDLSAIREEDFDFIFSFDSLVHAEIEIHELYIPQILQKLKPGGVAFIHHSNWASAEEDKPNTHCRAESVSAEAYARIVQENGGSVILQECLNWGTSALIDAFTLFTNSPNSSGEAFPVIANPDFMAEANCIRDTHSPYSSL